MQNCRIILLLASTQAALIGSWTYFIVRRMLTGADPKKWEDCVNTWSVIWLLNSFAIMVTASTHRKVLLVKIEKIETLANFLNAGCSDAFTTLPLSNLPLLYQPFYLEQVTFALSVLGVGLSCASITINFCFKRKAIFGGYASKANNWAKKKEEQHSDIEEIDRNDQIEMQPVAINQTTHIDLDQTRPLSSHMSESDF